MSEFLELKLWIGLAISFGVGAGTRYFDVPVPAPGKLSGAAMVAAITVGFLVTDWMLRR